jgi:hypothetical protein
MSARHRKSLSQNTAQGVVLKSGVKKRVMANSVDMGASEITSHKRPSLRSWRRV